MSDLPFKNIAVIGAGTMGAGIAGQIANAGHKVLLLDLPGKSGEFSAAERALDRLIKSDPPALHHKSCASLIETGDIENDFHLLKDCDWIVEAIVERLPLKKDLYARLHKTISETCVVTSNTSTIPIKLLVEDMPEDFRKRFAITHYFNPVRYMRLLELVRGADTDPSIMDRLADYNDRILGKGVVQCGDSPGFLGNRVGVFALQVGMDEAYKNGLNIEDADALMGRPLGIPKTGVFGLYDLIGVDLMFDVVDTLGQILPPGDAFFPVGKGENPVGPIIEKMISKGFTGEKGLGGFYRVENGSEEAMDLASGEWRARLKELPPKAELAAELQAANQETLAEMVAPSNTPKHDAFIRNFLGRVLGYAASLVPEITNNPQDIDDAMKLGFNWVRGPFEMIDALGAETAAMLMREAGVDVPALLQGNGPFYTVHGTELTVRQAGGDYEPIDLPEGTQRFSFTRQTLAPIFSNASASLWALPDDLRLIEFHSKANALTGASMEVVQRATEDHGAGIIVHNDAQHFSAGVDLNAFRAMIEAEDFDGIDAFLNDFQQAVKALKYTPVPVIGAPSGLAIGGGYEVLLHCDKLVAHANSVFGLVEAGVGVVPGGGGVKETFGRWLNATDAPEKAAWEAWMQIGYGKTGTSPETSDKLKYFLPNQDRAVMNRDKLITEATAEIKAMQDGYTPPTEQEYLLPGKSVLEKMDTFMSDGVAKGWFTPHNKTTALAIGTIVVNTENESTISVSEQDLYDRERAAFLTLARTSQTLERIQTMLDLGEPVQN
ncbi:MAG: 3-hydroxyacyl-CoA dehydrogenase NAD-binding domain-containing protein [Pseudomonadota bacterium]